jgi:hypothetical protein
MQVDGEEGESQGLQQRSASKKEVRRAEDGGTQQLEQTPFGA